MHGFQFWFVLIFFCSKCFCLVWKKGVVHYTINKLDYDFHSQDIISSTLAALQHEICIKFFQHPPGGNVTAPDKRLLFITNPDKVKNCQPNGFDFARDVIVMPIGYKCINEKAIARITAQMLKASIEHTVSTLNSYDLVKKFQEKDDPSHNTLLPASDRNFINAHYYGECGTLSQRVAQTGPSRRDDTQGLLSDDNLRYYENKLWPLGIVLYGVEGNLRDTTEHQLLRHAMASIELSSCLVFEEVVDDVTTRPTPRNLLWFGGEGLEVPMYGFQAGNQSIKLDSMVHGAPGHSAHALNNLLRALGVQMMSNRFDRDNYVAIQWKHVERGKERLLDKAPRAAWLEHMPYDFASATHAPANYACRGCELGAATVRPLQDHLWQKTISMGHGTVLSEADVQLLRTLYGEQCRNRFPLIPRDNKKQE